MRQNIDTGSEWTIARLIRDYGSDACLQAQAALIDGGYWPYSDAEFEQYMRTGELPQMQTQAEG